MVWCCGPMEVLTPEWGTDTAKPANDATNSSGYPGQRRQFARTEGNALIAAVPVLGGGEGSNDLVSVTVPEGIAPGQTIAVLAPDGSRLVKATIPPGLKPGDSFLVRLATPIQSDILNASPLQPPSQAAVVMAGDGAVPNFANSLDTYMTPAPNHPNFANALENWAPPAAVTAPVDEAKTNMAEAVATPVHERSAMSDPVAAAPSRMSPKPTPRTQQQQVQGQSINAQVEVAETRQESDAHAPIRTSTPTNSASMQQKLLLVHVPQGMMAGSTMQVEVPGENRTLIAQVPAGVSSFHVAYTPRPTPPQSRTPSPTMAPQQAPPPPPPHRALSSPAAGGGQRLLLVRVPLGTQAGTTLHVSVPDEPGRILAAQVPPGNVQEFHVSYEARTPQMTPAGQQQQRGAPYGQPPFYNASPQQTPVNNGYYPQPSGNYMGQQQQQQQHRMAAQQQQYNNANGRQQNNGGGMSNLLLPFLGGAALGAAGVATYDHFAHNDPTAADPNDYDAANTDYGGDYGGGDYGGDYDMGGGDFGF